MQVILLEKIGRLGKLGDIVNVAPGFARNFLFRRKKASRATTSAIEEFEKRRAELEKAAAEKRAAAQTLGEKLNGLTVQIVQKAGIDGRLFGSVTHAAIAAALQQQGFQIEKTQVHLPNGLLKTIGDFSAQIALHTDVMVEITVSVLGEHS